MGVTCLREVGVSVGGGPAQFPRAAPPEISVPVCVHVHVQQNRIGQISILDSHKCNYLRTTYLQHRV